MSPLDLVQQLPPAVATHTVMNAAERAAATADDGAKFAVIQLGARQYKVTPVASQRQPPNATHKYMESLTCCFVYVVCGCHQGDIVVADYNAALEVGTTTELDQVPSFAPQERCVGDSMILLVLTGGICMCTRSGPVGGVTNQDSGGATID